MPLTSIIKKLLFISFCSAFLFTVLEKSSYALGKGNDDGDGNSGAKRQNVAVANPDVTKLNSLKNDITTLNAEIKNLEKCMPNNCSQQQRSQLNAKKTRLSSKINNKNSLEQKMAYAALVANKEQDATKKINTQKNLNYLLMLANGGMATWMFTMCAPPLTVWPCMLGTQNVMQVGELYGKILDLDESKDPLTPPGVGGPGGSGPPDSHCQENPVLCKIGDAYKDGIITPSERADIDAALGCKTNNCFAGDDTPPIALPDSPPTNKKATKITRSNFNDLNSVDKASANKAINAFQNKNKKLFSKIKKALDENSSSLNSNKLVGGFRAGKTPEAPSGSFAGNQEDGDGTKNIKGRIQNLLAQFYSKKKNAFAGKTTTVGSDQVGVIQDNIFLMVHRRYQERRGHKQFIERSKKYSQPSKTRQQI